MLDKTLSGTDKKDVFSQGYGIMMEKIPQETAFDEGAKKFDTTVDVWLL